MVQPNGAWNWTPELNEPDDEDTEKLGTSPPENFETKTAAGENNNATDDGEIGRPDDRKIGKPPPTSKIRSGFERFWPETTKILPKHRREKSTLTSSRTNDGIIPNIAEKINFLLDGREDLTFTIGIFALNAEKINFLLDDREDLTLEIDIAVTSALIWRHVKKSTGLDKIWRDLTLEIAFLKEKIDAD